MDLDFYAAPRLQMPFLALFLSQHRSQCLVILHPTHLSVEQPPLHHLERLQHLVPHHLTIPHQLRLLPRLCLLILARIMRDVDRDHDIRTLLFQPQ